MVDSIAHEMATKAKQIAGALRKAGYEADFEVASLREIDRFLDEQTLDGRPKPRGLLSKDLGARVFALGAYIGEVVRQQSGGEWQGDAADPKVELTVSLRLPNDTVCFPTQRIMKRLRSGSTESIAAWADGLIDFGEKNKSRSNLFADEEEFVDEAEPETLATASTATRSRSWISWLGLDRRSVQIGLGVWLLMGFIGGWYPVIGLLAILATLLIAMVLLTMSWWQAFVYAWKNEPFFCVFFIIPPYFARYAAMTLPHTRRSLGLLLAGIGCMTAPFLILIPVQMAGAAVAEFFGQGQGAPVVKQENRAAPHPALPPGFVPGVVPGVVPGMPPGAPPFGPPFPQGVPPGMPPGFIPRQPTAEELAAARQRNELKKPKSLDEAVANLDSQDLVTRSQAIHFIVRAEPDPSRTDVATRLLQSLDDKIDPLYVDGVVKWGGQPHYAEMQKLAHRVQSYQLEKLLNAMIEIDSESTLNLCGELILDPPMRWAVKSVLVKHGAGSERVLIALLGHADSEVRYTAADILRQQGTLTALGPLNGRQALESDREVKRTIESAIKAIQKRGK